MYQHLMSFYRQIVFYCMDIQTISVQLSIDEYLGCFYFFNIINNGSMNIQIQDLVWTYVFISHYYIPRSEIAGSHGTSVLSI